MRDEVVAPYAAARVGAEFGRGEVRHHSATFARSAQTLPYERAKRCLDLLLSAILLVGLSPLLAVVALCVLIDDGRPVLFRSERLGRGGRRFKALKVRTMRVDANKWLASTPALAAAYAERVKLERDPRVTRIGRHLRRLSIDELPQLVNVLKGDMSLVGPRIMLPEEAERWGPLLETRLSVPPGITGLWQVSGRSLLEYDQRMQLDLEYVRFRSITLDLLILARTIPAVLTGRGAA